MSPRASTLRPLLCLPHLPVPRQSAALHLRWVTPDEHTPGVFAERLRRIRSSRPSRVRLQLMTRSRYGTRPRRQSSWCSRVKRPIPMSTSTGATTLPR